jgi:hypothetical protein
MMVEAGFERASTVLLLMCGYFFRALFFFRGTFAPDLRASESPMAMACLRLVTFLPEPLFKVPRFLSRMTRATVRLALFFLAFM